MSVALPASAAMVVVPPEYAKPARRLALASAALEVGLKELMERRLGEHGEPYRQDAASKFDRTGQACLAIGSALLAGTMLGLLYGLIQGSTSGWTAGPIASMAATATLSSTCAESFDKSGIALALFRLPRTCAASLITAGMVDLSASAKTRASTSPEA